MIFPDLGYSVNVVFLTFAGWVEVWILVTFNVIEYVSAVLKRSDYKFMSNILLIRRADTVQLVERSSVE